MISAFTEIAFDNMDPRLPDEDDEVMFLDTTGVKKDEPFLNRERSSRTCVPPRPRSPSALTRGARGRPRPPPRPPTPLASV